MASTNSANCSPRTIGSIKAWVLQPLGLPDLQAISSIVMSQQPSTLQYQNPCYCLSSLVTTYGQLTQNVALLLVGEAMPEPPLQTEAPPSKTLPKRNHFTWPSANA